jgi:hypothetical protein
LNADFVLYSGFPAEDLEPLVKKTGALGAIRKEGNPSSFAPALRRIGEAEASPAHPPTRRPWRFDPRRAVAVGPALPAARLARCPRRRGRVRIHTPLLPAIRGPRSKTSENPAAGLASALE